MKKYILSTILLIITLGFARAQSGIHEKWFAQNSDDAAESIVKHYEKNGDKLISLDDYPNYGYDLRGQKSSNLKETYRALVFESGNEINIRYTSNNQITKLIFNLKNAPSYYQLKSVLNLTSFKVINQSDDFEQHQNRDFKVDVYIESSTSPAGLIKNEYSVEIIKNNPGFTFRPVIFNLDSININNSYESIVNQLNSYLETKGFRFLNESELLNSVDTDGTLILYYKQYLYSDNLKLSLTLYPSLKIQSLAITSVKPLTQLKIQKIFYDEIKASYLHGVSSTEKVDKTTTITLPNNHEIIVGGESPIISALKYKNNLIYKLKNKNIQIDFYFDKEAISSQLKNTSAYSVERLLRMKSSDERLSNLLCNAHYDFIQNAITPCNHNKLHIANSIYNPSNDEHDICYFLSPDKKMVQVTYCNKANTDHPLQIKSNDMLFIEKLKNDFSKTEVANDYQWGDVSITGFKLLKTSVLQTNANIKALDDADREQKQRIAQEQQRIQNEENRIRREKEAQIRAAKAQEYSNTINQILQQIQKKP